MLMPASEPHSDEAMLGTLPSHGRSVGRPILISVTVVALGGLAFLVFHSIPGETEWSPAYVSVQDAQSDPPQREDNDAAPEPEPTRGERLEIWAGDEQTGRPGSVLSRPIAVRLLDDAGRPIPNRMIRFEVAPDGGTVEMDSVRTSGSGLATNTWRLGSDSSDLSVVATPAGNPEIRAQFSAEYEATLPGDAAAEQGAPATAERPATASEGAEETAPGPSRSGDASRTGPGRVGRSPAVTSWAGGGFNTCHVDTGGVVRCWGGRARNPAGFGILGDSIGYVAAGVFHVCGISVTFDVGCWSASDDSNDGTIVGDWVLPGFGNPLELAVGAEHVCARTDTGEVICWGSGERGQLGTGDEPRVAPPLPVDGVEGVVQLVSGWFHTCALTNQSAVFCWGANEAGQLGIGVPGNRSRPVPVDHGEPFSSIAAGSKRSCGLDRSGVAWCWGDGQAGAPGTDAAPSSHVPRRVNSSVSFTSLTVGGAHTCGLTESGRAWCWGQNVFGQLGTGTTEDSAGPLPVAGDVRFRFLISGGAHTCGKSLSGDLYCWGNNFSGQLGDGTQENSRIPVIANGP